MTLLLTLAHYVCGLTHIARPPEKYVSTEMETRLEPRAFGVL